MRPAAATRPWNYLFLLVPLAISLLSMHHPFFWDSVYYSRIALWYSESNFRHLLLPTELDAGHPPFFGLYLAVIWKVFGETLPVSHFSVLPFLIGIYWQFLLLAKRFFSDNRQQLLAMTFLVLEPTLLAQSTMVSNDLAIVFFYLLGINAVFSRRRILLALSLLGMAAVSTRGILLCPALFITELIFVLYFRKEKLRLISLWPYVISGLPISAWLYYHYTQTGWVLSTPAANWQGQRNLLGISGMFRNAGIFAWRLIDFGRIVWWILVIALLPVILKGKIYKDNVFRQLIVLCFIPLLTLSVFFVPFSNPIGHRYFLVFYVIYSLSVVYLLSLIINNIKRLVVIALISLMLIGGHFWKYPEGVAMGWDSTLAHLPYFSLRAKMISYIKKNYIPFSEVGSDFPNLFSLRQTDLVPEDWTFAEKDLSRNTYVFQSNIFNGFNNNELAELKNHWALLQEYHQGNVYVRLYKKP